MYAKTDDHFSIQGIPVTNSRHMHLKTGFLLDDQVLFLLLNGPQIEKSLLFNQTIYGARR